MFDPIFSVILTVGIFVLLLLWVPALEVLSRQLLRMRHGRATRNANRHVAEAASAYAAAERDRTPAGEGVLQG